MEDQIRIKLFIRQPEGFVLAETGEAMVERAERVESEIISVEREVFGHDAPLAGPVRISAPSLIAQHLLMPILAEFTALYPDLDMEVDATFEVADLMRRNADIVIRFSETPDPGLVCRKLPDIAKLIYATPDYIETHQFDGPDSDARWVALGSKEVLAHWRQGSIYSACKIQHVISDVQTQVCAVRAGLGFAYLPCFVADADPGLVRLADANPQFHPAWVLTHPDLNSTERVRICARILTDAVWRIEYKILGRALRSPIRPVRLLVREWPLTANRVGQRRSAR